MRIQNINQNNYQNRNVGFEANAYAFLRGFHCPSNGGKACEFAEAAAKMKLMSVALAQGVIKDPKAAEVVSQQTQSGLRLCLIDHTTELLNRIPTIISKERKKANALGSQPEPTLRFIDRIANLWRKIRRVEDKELKTLESAIDDPSTVKINLTPERIHEVGNLLKIQAAGGEVIIIGVPIQSLGTRLH